MWQHFKMQVPQVLRMLERIETWRMWVLCDREPVKNWTQGPRHAARRRRASDAAISGAGRLHGDRGCGRARREGRGASLTIRPAAFQAYQQARYLRTGRTQIMARVYGEFYHARGVAAELRDMALSRPHARAELRRHRVALRRT